MKKKRKYDLVGNIMAYESTGLNPSAERKLFKKLKKRKMLGSLQGSYGRRAKQMGY